MLARRFWHLRLGRSFAPGSCLTQELLKAGFPLGLRLLPGCGRKVREPGGERLSLLHGAIELYSFGLFAGVVLPAHERALSFFGSLHMNGSDSRQRDAVVNPVRRRAQKILAVELVNLI